ncbi:LytR family transcriptional regulator [Clostridium carboxidivorans P7]|uniref:Cell envelope-related transcriptional attenuator n=1 Tax=Clostridium carboxidivorans P7 TaxID=536227 RepID=C6PS10_9CLOT|nr:LCP family protein [Clostridium carboxidivorans]AKN31939.1 LytR family transcriptional regulator [Clostridium carboxidivorans P7]EET87935.1 cell envelope-related transcriptional attenuator [Clostridium carboxidivorans P7]
MRKTSKIILSTITVLFAAIGTIILCFNSQLNKVKKAEIPKTNSELNISNNVVKKDDEIINIALFGVDRRQKDEASRSDALMILTLDKKHKKIKISSIMRDAYVNIDGYGMTKINHAYAYGGPMMSIKTLNKNFDLNIKDYVTVDFFGFEKIIDSVGGVEVNITPEELKYINNNTDENSESGNKTASIITNSGLQKVNGRQALEYTRIRKNDGGDFQRTERQRTVLIHVLNKIKKVPPTGMLSLISQLLPYTETSIPNTEILKKLMSVYTLGIKDIGEQRFPLDGYCYGKMIDNVWYLIFDLNATKNQMHQYIFEDIKPSTVK